MPFARGTPKPPRSGRRKGTPNRATAEVSERLANLGCDPIAILAGIANDTTASAELRVKVNCELLQYLYPKRKAVEHSGPDGEAIHVKRLIGLQFEDI